MQPESLQVQLVHLQDNPRPRAVRKRRAMESELAVSGLDDLVNQAERLTAEITAGSHSLPRVERNLKQLAEAGNQLWMRNAVASAQRNTVDVRASVLLGSKGYDLQKVSQKLDSLSDRKSLSPVHTDSPVTEYDLDVQSFLKYERERAILSVIDDVKKSTLEKIDLLYWQNLEKDWTEEKNKILNSNLSAALATSTTDSVMEESGALPKDIVAEVLGLIQNGKPYDSVLGIISSDGCRIPGSIDTMKSQAEVDNLINEIAKKAEQMAFLEDAVRLYDLAGDHEKALRILNTLLTTVINEKPGQENSTRDRLEGLALKLAERYSMHGHRADRATSGTFFLLLDLMTFFSSYHKQSYIDALDIIEKLQVVPFSENQIGAKVSEFKSYSKEIQHNIPDILVTSMNILYSLYKEAKASHVPTITKFGLSPESIHHGKDARLSELRSKARTLITYAGMIPFRMHKETNEKLIQLEVLMN